jgi:hypothetical protein
MTALQELALRYATSQIGVSEQPAFTNSGLQVDQYLRAVNLNPGNYWCMAFAYWSFNQAAIQQGVKNPLYKTASTSEFLKQAYIDKRVFSIPEPGDIFIVRYSADTGHAGIVTDVNGSTFKTIEGNTNGGPGIERNGGGVYQKTHTLIDSFFFVRYSGVVNLAQPDINKYISAGVNNNTNHGITTDSQKVAVNPNEDLNFNFERIQQTIDSLEQEDVLGNVGWGQRTNNLEETDWIGLKQYLLYLNTTYYPQVLVPFVELIPVFSMDTPQVTTQREVDDITNKLINDTSLTNSERENLRAKLENSNQQTMIDDRYQKTAAKLVELTKGDFIDMLAIDPFQETTTLLNQPNSVGLGIQKERGLSSKIQGMIVFNSKIIGDELSKAGSIGFESLEIDSGSQTQNNMSLITIKIRDVQGNKLLDVNSPWSFILNSRPGMIGADFYFRYGWQVRIPEYNTNKLQKDEIAQKFWDHPGWNLFGGEAMQQEISGIASVCDNTITLTQSIGVIPNGPNAFKTPGYVMQGNKEIIQRQLNPVTYVLLTLINPEISVEPEDGSIVATLYFRTNSVVANLLCPLYKGSKVAALFK